MHPDGLAALQRLPQAMRALPQWLVWRLEQAGGEKKPRKVPYYTSGARRKGEQGSERDRQRLVTFDAAVQALERGGDWSGIGFAFLRGDGLIGIDIDGAIDAETGEVSSRCQAIVAACASYTERSPSGTGVHIIVQGQTDTFKNNAVGLEVFCGRQYFTCTGQHWGGAPLEVAPIAEATLRRLRATVRGVANGAPAAATHQQARPEEDLAHRLEGALLALHPDLHHDDWVQVGMALKHALGEAGFRLWDYWSSRGTKYPGTEKLVAKWTSFRGSGVTEATVFKMAKEAGWRPARPRRAQLKLVSATPSAGSAEEGDAASPEAAPPDPPDGDRDDWRRLLLRGPNGGKRDCRENVYVCLVHHPDLTGLVGYDEFAHRVVKLRAPPWDSSEGEWSTNDDYLLAYWLAQHERLTLKAEGTVIAGVAMAAYHARFHPVLDYLHGLPAWDGIERLVYWLHDCLGADDTTYTRLVAPWFLMGMVQRVMHPGCQMDYMIVLEGLQGKHKSTALRTLVGRDAWFADTPIRIGDKDALLSLAGIWLYEIGELDAFNRAEVTAVKQYVSSRVDRVREPFARRVTDRPRSGVFGGTTNQSEYFKDPTGARRFWPVSCSGEVDLVKLAEWRDQLWAECLHRLRHEDPEMRRYWPTRDEEEKYLVPEQERREINDPWGERLAGWLVSHQKFSDTMHEVCEVDSFTTFELLTKCLGVAQDRIDGGRQMATRVGMAMHKLGWAKRRDAGGARVWRYWRPKAAASGGEGQGS